MPSPTTAQMALLKSKMAAAYAARSTKEATGLAFAQAEVNLAAAREAIERAATAGVDDDDKLEVLFQAFFDASVDRGVKNLANAAADDAVNQLELSAWLGGISDGLQA